MTLWLNSQCLLCGNCRVTVCFALLTVKQYSHADTKFLSVVEHWMSQILLSNFSEWVWSFSLGIMECAALLAVKPCSRDKFLEVILALPWDAWRVCICWHRLLHILTVPCSQKGCDSSQELPKASAFAWSIFGALTPLEHLKVDNSYDDILPKLHGLCCVDHTNNKNIGGAIVQFSKTPSFLPNT